MKNFLLGMADKILLRKRVVIKTVNDKLKHIAQIECYRLCFFVISLTVALYFVLFRVCFILLNVNNLLLC